MLCASVFRSQTAVLAQPSIRHTAEAAPREAEDAYLHREEGESKGEE